MQNTLEQELAAELFNPENLRCPYSVWKRLRTEQPVLRCPLPGTDKWIYIVSRRQDIEYVCSNPALFSSTHDPDVYRWGQLPPEFDPVFEDGGFRLPLTLVNTDPPVSQFWRRIITEALKPGAVKAMKPDLQGLIDSLLDALPLDEIVDFKRDFAVPFPIDTITYVLGLPREDRDFIFEFTNEIIKMVDPVTPLEIAMDAARAVVHGEKYLAPKVLEYRERPLDNLLSAVSNTRYESGELLSMEDALSVTFTTVVAGNETSRNTIVYAVYQLAKRREIWDALKENPDAVPTFVEEALRQASPAAAVPRRATCDTEVAGVPIPEGSSLFLLWGSANHDEEVVQRPEMIDLTRSDARRHMAFGFGVHHCAGIHLAKPSGSSIAV
jgi:cytochrome P450